jgi:long-chain acyl-CoA synthetase
VYPGTYAALTPDKAAVIVAETGETVSFGDLDANSIRLARYFHAVGLRRGDVVALLSENDPRVFEIYWAAQRSGLYLTTINHHLTAGEIAYIVNDSGARVVVASASAALKQTLPALCPGVDAWLAFGGPVDGYVDYDGATQSMTSEALEDQPRGADLLYSSGTTGRPKGIMPPLPDRQVDEKGDAFAGLFGPRYGFGTGTTYLSPAPLYHSAPLRFCATVQALGGTVVMMRKFREEAALANIEKFTVTHSQWVPTMFVRLLKLPAEVRARYDLGSHQVAIHAAAPCPVEVKERMIDWWGPIIEEYYSSTEANGITFIDSKEWLTKPGSVGRAGLGRIRICSEEGAERPTGEVGLVYFERDALPFRYHNDDEKTAAAKHPSHPNWTTTGDIGYVDDESYLFLTDRKAFVIISGGVNIYPQEVENCLALHPAVRDVAVIGVPDDDMGQIVKAYVEPAPGVDVGEELAQDLIDYVCERIARFKAPRSVEFVSSLPRTETGKLQKSSLMQRASSPT